MKKLLLFFTVVLSLIGVSPTGLAAPSTVYLFGSAVGKTGTPSSSNSVTMNKSGNVFTYTFTASQGDWLKISSSIGSNWSAFESGGIVDTSRRKSISVPATGISDKTLVTGQNCGGNWCQYNFSAAGTYILRLDYDNNKFSLTPPPTAIYLIGSAVGAVGSGTWAPTTSIAKTMTKSGDVFTYTINATAGSWLKISSAIGTDWAAFEAQGVSSQSTASKINVSSSGIPETTLYHPVKCDGDNYQYEFQAAGTYILTLNFDTRKFSLVPGTPAATITSVKLYDETGAQKGTFTGNSLSVTVDRGTTGYYLRADYSDGSTRDYSITDGSTAAIANGKSYSGSALFSGTTADWGKSHAFTFPATTDGNNPAVKLSITKNNANTSITTLSASWDEAGSTDAVQEVSLLDWNGTNYGVASYKDGVWMVTATGITAPPTDNSNKAAKFVFQVTYHKETNKYVTSDNKNQWITTMPGSISDLEFCPNRQTNYFSVKLADRSKTYDFLLEMNAEGTTATKISVREHVSENMNFEDWPTKKWNLETAFKGVYGTPQAGDKLYFYLSTTQNDNRVGPEWMLLPKDSSNPRAGEFVLEDFMVIPNGNFRIREFTYKSSGSYDLKDLKNSAGAVELGKSSFGISQGTPLAEGAQPKVELTLSDGGGLSKWQIGYTRMTLTVKTTHTEAYTGPAIDNYGILYSGSKNYTYVYAWNSTGDENAPWPGQKLLDAGNGIKYAEFTHQFANFKFSGDGQTGDLAAKGTMPILQYADGDVVNRWSPIPDVTHPASDRYDMTAALLLDKPSTLSEAPVQGMPYLTLYGSELKPRLGAYQTLDYILTLNTLTQGEDAPDNEAYSNAFLQYDEEGNLYEYGDNITSAYYVQGETDGIPATGKVMNSTIQPPRNLMYFRIKDVDNDTYYNLTSRTTQFKHEGTYSDKATADASDGKIKEGKKLQPTYTDKNVTRTAATGTRYARYSLENFNMMGNYKVMSGYGSHSYIGTVNGLSLYTNWGISEGGTYGHTAVESGSVYPLSGAGPIFTSSDTAPDGDSDSNQDNKAGMYVGFTGRAYVSKAYFYYAIDHDKIWETESHHYHRANDILTVGNNGRNASWIMFVYSNTAAQIDLKKIDVDKAQMTWLVGDPAGTADQKDAITHYKVELFKADKNGEPTGSAIYTYTSENYTTPISYIPETSQMAVDANGSEMVLDGGAYVAKLTYYGNLIIDEDIVNNTSREVLSSVIHVYKVSADPALEANQVTKPITTKEGDEGTEYTFDGLIESNLKAYIENLIAQDFQFDVAGGQNFTVKLTFPRSAWQTVTVEKEDHTMAAPEAADVTEAEGKRTLNLGTYFLAQGDSYRLPNVRVYDYVPGRTYPVSLSVEVANHPEVNATASTDLFIKAPAGKFGGNMQTGTTVQFDGGTRTEQYDFLGKDANAYDEDYNFAEVTDGYISIEGTEVLDGETAKNWMAVYDLYLSSGDDEMISLFDESYAVNGDGKSTTKKLVNVPVSHIGYIPEMDGETVVETPDRDYTFTVITNYTLKDPPEGAIDYTSAIKDNPRTTVLKYRPEGLKAPRTDLADLNATGSTDTKAKDWVRVKYDWFEQYSGAFRVVEDAYVAAEVGEPSALAFKFNAMKQTIRHNANSVFNKNNHLSSDDGATPHSAAPGLRMPQIGEKETGFDAPTENVYWFNTGWRKAPVGFEERVYKGASGIFYEGEKPNQIVVEDKLSARSVSSFADHEPAQFWAGCHGDVWSDNSLLVDGKERITYADMPVSTGGTVRRSIDRLDPQLGLYGNRNHQNRRAWDGGEVFEQKWLNLCVTKRASKDHYDSSIGQWVTGSIEELLASQSADGLSIPNPFLTEVDANTYLNTIPLAVEEGIDYAWNTAMYDSEDKDAYIRQSYREEEFIAAYNNLYARNFFLAGKYAAPVYYQEDLKNLNSNAGVMRVMLRVPHVNHESWWEPRAGYTEGLQRWKNEYGNVQITNLSGEKKTVGVDATFEDMIEGLIMVPTKYYAPLEYSFVYEYPFLNTNEYASATPSVPQVESQESNSKSMVRSNSTEYQLPASDNTKHTYIPAVSTGEIPFDYATTGSGKGTATDIESVGADNGDGADRFSVRYDRSIDAVVVSSSAPLGDIRVVSTTGALLRHVDASQQTLVTIPVDALSSGAYIVSVEGRKGVTFLK